MFSTPSCSEDFYNGYSELRVFALHRSVVLHLRCSHGRAMACGCLVGESVGVVGQCQERVIQDQANQQHRDTQLPEASPVSTMEASGHSDSPYAINISLSSFCGQGDAQVPFRCRGEKGTGARGAPVPKVGLEVKFKRFEFRSLESLANEGHMNSW